MNLKLSKPAALTLFGTLIMTACAEPPNYAPVQTVNQALEPNNGYYLRNKISTRPEYEVIKKEESAVTNSKDQNYVPNIKEQVKKSASSPKLSQNITAQSHLPNKIIQKDAEKSSKNALVKLPKGKSQTTKNPALAIHTQQTIESHKISSLKSSSNIASAQNIENENPIEPANSKGKQKNKKSIISIDNKKVLKLNFQWPLHGKISQNFSQTDNKGILIRGKTGQAVHAAESGKAVYCGHGLVGFGNLAIIKHNETYLTAYANNRKLFIKEGELVSKGQMIGQIGSTGLRSSSLHFEIRKNGKPINPLTALPKL
jgi:murein DD-endopeptidase MepM/ murein hydrolase activator NlpD